MGILIKSPYLPKLQRSFNRSSSQYEGQHRRRRPLARSRSSSSRRSTKSDRSVLDRHTIESLVAEVRHRHDPFPKAGKNHRRSRKRWGKKQKSSSSSRSKTNGSRRGHREKQQRKHRSIRCTDSTERKRSISLEESTDTESDIVSEVSDQARNVPCTTEKENIALFEAFECVAGPGYDFNTDGDDDEYYSCDEYMEDDYSQDKRQKKNSIGAVTKLSHSISPSKFVKAIGKLGRNWVATGTQEKRTIDDCHGADDVERFTKSNDSDDNSHSTSSILDKEAIGYADLPKEPNASCYSNEELDPIFVSGLDLEMNDKDHLRSLDDVSVLDNAHHGVCVDGANGERVEDRDDNDERVEDKDSRDDTILDCEVRNEFVDNDEISTINVNVDSAIAMQFEPPSPSPSEEEMKSLIINSIVKEANKILPPPSTEAKCRCDAIVKKATKHDLSCNEIAKKPKKIAPPPSREPEPLWVKNQDTRNELAWIRCAARNRERPTGFPIPREREYKKSNYQDEPESSSMCFSWYFSCGDVFVL